MKKIITVSLLAFLTTMSLAQKDHGKMDDMKKTNMSSKIKYTCTMHPEVISDKPGKCPKCGMNLVEKKAEAAKVYTCPMHTDVKSDKPGNCPKCGMNLVEKKNK